MPLDTAGKVKYRDVLTAEGIRFQVSPPVCNICKEKITRETVGCVYIESEKRNKTAATERFERVECTSCSLVRESGTRLLTFLKRHHL